MAEKTELFLPGAWDLILVAILIILGFTWLGFGLGPFI